MMKITPINQAEAIIAPLFDREISNWQEFLLVEDGRADGQFTQQWDSCTIESQASDFSLIWQGALTVAQYDALRFFIAFPGDVLLSGSMVVNGERRVMFGDIAGDNVPIEPTSVPFVIPGEQATLTEIRLDFQAPAGGETQVCLRWIGLLASWREQEIEAALPRYAVTWPGLLNPNGKPGLTQTLLFDAEELAALKARIRLPAFADLAASLQYEAAQWEAYAPEPDIREYIPCDEHLYRYVRVRDRGRPILENAIMTLAVAGFLFDREDWSRLAARMVLAVAHTPKWFEGPQGCLDGSSWHHVCFMEDHYSSALAIAVPLLGDLLTPAALKKVLDGMEHAWQVVNASCEAPGYRWFMNQGMVGNRGRLLGALFLYRYGRGERYRAYIEQSYADHTKIVNFYLNDEGHCFEGPGYFQYTFGSAVTLWTAYAHYRQTPIAQVVPGRLRTAIQYIEALMSSNTCDGQVIPLDATKAGLFSPLLLGFFDACFGWDRGVSFLTHRLEHGTAETSEQVSGLDALLLLKFLPEARALTVDAEPRLGGCMQSGLLAYRFPEPAVGKFWLCSERFSAGHCHEDRGSILLEANGDTLLLDPGTTNYSNPVGYFMKHAAWHNVAYPEGEHMVVGRSIDAADEYVQYPPMLDTVEELPNGVRFAANLAPVYSASVFVARREGELILRPGKGLLIVRDRWALAEARAIHVTYQSYAPWTIQGHTACTQVGETTLTIRFAEEQGLGIAVTQDSHRVDWRLRPVYALVATTETTREAVICAQLDFNLVS
ncbi:MAG TPA: heparinase II/III family protein [Armatimonadota bacterium]|jgi:hypothetical protein